MCERGQKGGVNMTILLTGGSACGKSGLAEYLTMAGPQPRYYIAAMQPYGDEGQKKIARHRALRAGKGFATVERYRDLEGLDLPRGGTALLECLCNLTANEMFDDQGGRHDPIPPVLAGLEHLMDRCANLVVVTNDVGSDLQPYGQGTLDYIRALGEINRGAAERFDAVIEMVSGIPILRKGRLPLPETERGDTDMILVIGAAASGKRDYVRSLGYREEDISADLAGGPVLAELQDLVSADPMAAEGLLPRLLEKEVVICNEVGSGVIPMSFHDRMSREQTGRLCVQLARRAKRVVRLVCGIPTVLK